MPKSAMPPLKFEAELVKGNAKAAMREADAKSRNYYMVPVGQIHVIEGFNIRITDSPSHRREIEKLKHSIRQYGFYPTRPLGVFPARDGEHNVVNLVKGHRRFEAVQELIAEGFEIEALPVIAEPEGTSLEDLTESFWHENSDQQPSPMEQAIIVKRMLGSGRSEAQIAERLNITPRYVSDLLLLIGAPKTVRDMVIAEKVAATLAIETLRRHGNTAIDKLRLAVQRAEAAGKTKATAKDMQGPKLARTKIIYAIGKGERKPLDELKAIRPLISDSDWYELTENEGEIAATEDIRITVTIERPEKPGAEKPKKAARKAAEPPGKEVDPATFAPIEPGDADLDEAELVGADDL